MTMLLKPGRVAARDRRYAAIHEAGHVVIGRHIGLRGVRAWLEKTSNPEPLFDKFWIGKTQYIKPSALGETMSRKKLALFAVAGAVAERCWNKYTFEDSCGDEFWLDENVMSESDWLGCDCDPGNPTRKVFEAIEAAFSLLERNAGALWPALMSEARRLIVDSRSSSFRAGLANLDIPISGVSA